MSGTVQVTVINNLETYVAFAVTQTSNLSEAGRI